MFLTRKHISRRQVLRGAGVSLGLPLLESMIPAQTRLERPATRLACIEMVHGAAGSTDVGKRYWSPAKEGSDFDLTYSLEPLAPLRPYLTIVSGTDARTADASTPAEFSADHFRSSSVFLTGARPARGRTITCGTSIDQIYAQKIVGETTLPSLQLGIERPAATDSCGFEYSCKYIDTISWASPADPLLPEINPRVIFERLFGTGDAVLDAVLPEVSRIRRAIGPADRTRLDAHLDDIRALERRIEAIEKRNASAEQRENPLAPLGVPDSWEEHVKLMFDLQVRAFAADATRVITFKLSRDTNNRIFPESGVRAPFHTLSHHNEEPGLVADFARLNRYHVGVAAYFLERLRATQDGDGNLLDHALVLYGSPMGDSNSHNHRRLPMFLAGHASGALKGNLHRICKPGTPHANVLLSVLRKLDLNVSSIGDSSGDIAL